VSDAEDFSRLARRLKDAGETGLRRELRNAINDAVSPFADAINGLEYLKPYMPDRYAGVLAGDLAAVTRQQASPRAYGVKVTVRGRRKARQVQTLNRGFLRHPVFPRNDMPRDEWTWRTQGGPAKPAGMRPGFFTNAVEAAKPEIRRQVTSAMQAVAKKVAGY
jgi:hypothetical protein